MKVVPMLRYCATSERVKSLSLASGYVDVCVLSYFLLAIRKISPCQIFKKMNCRKIAQKRIGRRKNDTKIKVCRF